MPLTLFHLLKKMKKKAVILKVKLKYNEKVKSYVRMQSQILLISLIIELPIFSLVFLEFFVNVQVSHALDLFSNNVRSSIFVR